MNEKCPVTLPLEVGKVVSVTTQLEVGLEVTSSKTGQN